MTKAKKTIFLFVLISVTILSLIATGSDDTKLFKEMSKEDKIKFLNDEITKHKNKIVEIASHFDQNWAKETDEVKVVFCKLMGLYRAKESISILVKNLDFYPMSPIPRPPRGILEDHYALEALAQIGVPALEPTSNQICAELEKLILSEDTRHRIHFLRQALKYLLVEVLGKKMAIYFIEDKINNKDTSVKLKEHLTIVLEEIKQSK